MMPTCYVYKRKKIKGLCSKSKGSFLQINSTLMIRLHQGNVLAMLASTQENNPLRCCASTFCVERYDCVSYVVLFQVALIGQLCNIVKYITCGHRGVNMVQQDLLGNLY